MARKIGRPTLYSPKVVAKIVAAIKLGNTKEDAARAAGISGDTFFTWQGKHPAFALQVEAAVDAVKPKLVGTVHRAAFKGEWRAALAILERRYPDWSKTTKIEGGDKPIIIDSQAEQAEIYRKLASMSSDDLLALVTDDDQSQAFRDARLRERRND